MILGFLKNASVQLATIQGTFCSTSTIKALSGQSTMETFQVPALATKTEIWWALKIVMPHFSLRSCLELNCLFKFIFPDSLIASWFSLSRAKCIYFINFGLGPYFTDILLSQVKASSFFVNSYDESVNKILQN